SFSFVLRVEGLEHSAHLTAVTAGKPGKTLFLWAFQRVLAYHNLKANARAYPQFTHNHKIDMNQKAFAMFPVLQPFGLFGVPLFNDYIVH
ncbi:MAG: hypothetical protein ACI39W_01905, partial [Brotaphodocola sp.]